MSAQILSFPMRKSPQQLVVELQDEYEIRMRLRKAISDCGRRTSINDNKVSTHAANYLRVLYKVQDTNEIPKESLQEAIRIVGLMDEACNELHLLKRSLDHWFLDEVIAAGTPWTPAIKSKFTRKLREKLPNRPDWKALAERFPVAAKRREDFED